MRGKIAWLKSPVRHRTLAPFGGITRIRFKGSSNRTSQPLRLPRCVESRIRPELAKSTQRNCRASVSDARPIGSAFGTRNGCETTAELSNALQLPCARASANPSLDHNNHDY